MAILNPKKLSHTARITASETVGAGELDGGRVAAGLWGRPAGRALSTLTLLILGIGAEQLPCACVTSSVTSHAAARQAHSKR